jgi:hydrogenase maturation protein HypF
LRKGSLMGATRACVYIEGIVQGVGFRPFVYHLAHQHELTGWVLNSERGVTIEVEGDKHKIDGFLSELSYPPPMAVIEKTAISFGPPMGYQDFEIKESEQGAERLTLVSPDIATCQECVREISDPEDRRFRYPFTNCTNCGPRFTIIENVPYDRHYTTMAPFEMCPSCDREYHDPANRRFHAQPNACILCGPSLTLVTHEGAEVSTVDPLVETVGLLKRGKIVAIKGLGGFHLACDATNEEAVARLRGRKYREDKPFAIMCRDIGIVEKVCILDKVSRELLESKARPIVVLPKRDDNPTAPSVVPYQKTLGVMLPYSPLHHLLFTEGLELLVMTSGNVSDEPIAFDNNEALIRLKDIADYFLLHNRAIHTRCDDSVVKPVNGKVTFFRRSRGYTPAPIKLPYSGPSVLACGAELKSTFCLTKNDFAFVSHHIGDMENVETMRSFEQGIELFRQLFQINPELVVYDLHPDYLATRYAMSVPLPKVGLQHHVAHALSCMAEYGHKGPVLAVVMDGTGYGDDGTVWGGEFLEVYLHGYRRLGHLRSIPLPGGEMAVKEPWRVAAAYLERIYGDLEHVRIPFTEMLDYEKWSILRVAIREHINCPPCSSVGRLFDAVSALVGLRPAVNYEGQAAVELEQLAEAHAQGTYPFELCEADDTTVIDPDPMIAALVEEIKHHVPPSHIATRFHHTLANIISQVVIRLRERTGLSEVVISGGVFQNALLLGEVEARLSEVGSKIYTHHKVPPNDGGISLGQAYYGIHYGGRAARDQ